MHILLPETDNCPSWISRRERMTVENISWSVSTKECCRPLRGLNQQPPGLQSDGASNWATEASIYGVTPLLNFLQEKACPEHIWKYRRELNETWYIDRWPSEEVQSASKGAWASGHMSVWSYLPYTLDVRLIFFMIFYILYWKSLTREHKTEFISLMV